MLEVIQREPVPLRRLQGKVPRDLEVICLKCLQKDQRKRYATADALADDLKRFQEGRPIVARPVPAWERGWKLARRHPAVAALIGLAAVAFVGFIGFILTLNAQLQRNLNAEKQATFEKQARFLEQARNAYEKARASFSSGQAALRDRKGDIAQSSLKQALEQADLVLGVKDLIGTDAADQQAELWKDAATLRQEVEPVLQNVEARLKAQEDYTDFKKQYDEAVLLAVLVEGAEPAERWKRLTAVAGDALRHFEAPAGSAGPLGGRFQDLNPDQKQEIATAAGELLVLCAEAEAGKAVGGGADSARKALTLLDRAELVSRAGGERGVMSAVHRLRGDYLKRLGEKERGEAETKLAQAAPAEDGDSFLAGVVAWNDGRTADARQAFERALQRQSDRFWPRYFLALCYLKQPQLTLARLNFDACLSRPLELAEAKAWVFLYRAYTFAEQDDYKSADADFQRAEEAAKAKDSRQADRLLSYSLPLYRGNRYAREANRNQDAEAKKGLLEKAAAEFEKARAIAPDWHQAYVNLAEVRQQQASLTPAESRRPRLEESAKLFDEALKRADQQPDDVRARLHYRRGRVRAALAGEAGGLGGAKRPGKNETDGDKAALADLGQAMKLAPTSLDALLEQARIYQRGRRYTELRETCQKAIDIKKDFAPAYRLKAEAELRLGHYDDVLKTLDRYLVLARADLGVYLDQGLAYMMVRPPRHKEAEKAYTTAFDMVQAERGARKQPPAARGPARGPLASLSDAELDREEAVCRIGKGWSYAARGDWKGALDEFTEAARRDPASGYALISLGYARAKRGSRESDLKQAADETRKGLDLLEKKPPRPPGLLLTAAKVYAQAAVRFTGRQSRQYEEAAVLQIELALSTFPDESKRKAFWDEAVTPTLPGNPPRHYIEPDLKPILQNPKFVELQLKYGAQR